jgi:hypothetical protein
MNKTGKKMILYLIQGDGLYIFYGKLDNQINLISTGN